MRASLKRGRIFKAQNPSHAAIHAHPAGWGTLVGYLAGVSGPVLVLALLSEVCVSLFDVCVFGKAGSSAVAAAAADAAASAGAAASAVARVTFAQPEDDDAVRFVFLCLRASSRRHRAH